MIYKINEFADRTGVSTSTLRRLDKTGLFTAKRTITNQRFYDDDDVRHWLHKDKVFDKRLNIVYCRVSSVGQKDDLASQVDAMDTFVLNMGLPVDIRIKEIGGGMNFKRKQFLKIIRMILRNEVNTLVVAHKDRLARFGFDLIEEIATMFDTKIIVANQEKLSPQAEMVEDLMSIIHTFSCRLYGLRKYKKKTDLMGRDDDVISAQNTVETE